MIDHAPSRLIFAALLCGVGFVLAVVSFAARPANARAASKIAPWVMQETAGGREAEFLVVLSDQSDLSGAEAVIAKSEKGRHVRDALWTKAQTTQAPLLDWLRAQQVEHRSYYIVNLIWVKAGYEIAAQLAERSDVARIEGNPLIHNPNLPAPSEQSRAVTDAPAAVEPGISHTRAPEVWALGHRGAGIVIGGADTGYRWDHAALKNKYRGWNGLVANHDYNWHDSIHSGSPACGPNSSQPCDGNGHGTHTMGTAVGDDGLGNQIGMAPEAKWIGCRNMDNGGNGTPATYLECMEFFLAPYPVGGTPAQGDPSLAPNVTNNSWTCPPDEGCNPETLQQGVIAQRAAGILMVAVAGNSGPSCSTVNHPPSTYDEVYTVGALNTGTDTIASFSARGPVTVDGSSRLKPDITAPGNVVRSASGGDPAGYHSLQGTSMAAPHVAGAVALLWSADPSLRGDIERTERLLNDSAADILSAGCETGGVAAVPNNTYGYGRLDVKAALAGAFLDVLNVARSGDDVIITFQAVTGATYRLQRRTSLTSGSWQDVTGVADITAANTQPEQVTHTGGAADPTAYYRIALLQ